MSAPGCIEELVKGGRCRASAKPETKDGAYCRLHDPDRTAQQTLDAELRELQHQIDHHRAWFGSVLEDVVLAQSAFEELDVLQEASNEALAENFNPEKVKALTALAAELRLSRKHRLQLALNIARHAGVSDHGLLELESRCLDRWILSGRKFPTRTWSNP